MVAALETLGTSQKNKKELNRLYKVYLNEAYNKLDILIKKSLEEEARNQYNYMYRSLERGIEQNLPQGTLTKQHIQAAINKSIGGMTLTQRLGYHKATLFRDLTATMQKDIRDSIAKRMAQGESIDRMTKHIRAAMNTSRYNARRVVRTEAHRMREWGNNWAMTDAKNTSDMFDKEWLSTRDGRTREAHKRLNGQFADEKGLFHMDGFSAEYPGNFNVAKMDIHCRCTMVANFDKVLKNPNEDYVNQDNLTSEEWANKPILPGKYNGLSTSLNGSQLAQVLAFIGTLDQAYNPKSVVAGLLQTDFTSKDINDKMVRERFRALYLEYLDKSYKDMGIETKGLSKKTNKIENEALGKQYALIKHISDKTGIQLSELSFEPLRDPRATAALSYFPGDYGPGNYPGMIITPKTYGKTLKDRQAMAKLETEKGWHGRVLPNGDDSLLVSTAHELGHAVDFKHGWVSDRIPYDKVYAESGYALHSRNEAAAEAFTEVIFNPLPESSGMWNSMGIKTEGLQNVKYAKILE